jgi:TolB protein
MLRAPVLALVSLPFLACAAPMRVAVTTTDAATRLEQMTHSQANEFDPAISPDAKAIAYEVEPSRGSKPHVEVASLEPSQRGRVEYTSKDEMGLEPTWMPDGSGLIFVSDAFGAHHLVQTIGNGPSQTAFLASAGDPYHFAAWPAVSPDGKTMAMSLVDTDVFESGWQRTRRVDPALGLSDLFGAGFTVLGAGSDPAWSPDGKHLAFSRVSGGHPHLFVAGADGGDAQQITEGPDDDQDPAWSPDGRLIAHANDGSWTEANLFVVRPDGSGLVQLTEGPRLSCRPSWGRDGFIYFHSNATDAFHIWRIRPRAD